MIVTAASAKSQWEGRPLTSVEKNGSWTKRTRGVPSRLASAPARSIEPFCEPDGSSADGAHLQARGGHRDAYGELVRVLLVAAPPPRRECERDRERGPRRRSPRAPADRQRLCRSARGDRTTSHRTADPDAAVRGGLRRHVGRLVEGDAADEVARPRQPHLVRDRPGVHFLAEDAEAADRRLESLRSRRDVQVRTTGPFSM